MKRAEVELRISMQGQRPEPVPQLEQVLAVAAQLACHAGRRLARGDAVEDQQKLRGAAVRLLQDGPSPGVEDAAAKKP